MKKTRFLALVLALAMSLSISMTLMASAVHMDETHEAAVAEEVPGPTCGTCGQGMAGQAGNWYCDNGNCPG